LLDIFFTDTISSLSPGIQESLMSPLLTDLYQLTMACGYWQLGMHERKAVFHQIFRKNPFHGNYALAAGLASVVEFLENWHFSRAELDYLGSLQTPEGRPRFPRAFLDYLAALRFDCDIDAVPEGTLVFPHEPLLRVTGSLLQGQLVESALLNFINFQTLIATKASRVCLAADGDPVAEFGLRRAQGPDGALSASRAAYIGGCSSTSNVLAGMRFGIPVSGTQGHSWMMAFADETAAFNAFADISGESVVLLVDTWDTLQGVRNAIALAKSRPGICLRAIRLDSGDLAELSIQARALLDAAGFTSTEIMASNSLDEQVIAALKRKGAKISRWGVGTSLVTSQGQPALDGVYKLSALCSAQNVWEYRIKLSEDDIKISNPGILQVRRYSQNGRLAGDVIYDTLAGLEQPVHAVALEGPVPVVTAASGKGADLLQPVLRAGKNVAPSTDIHAVRVLAMDSVREFVQSCPGTTAYPVGLCGNLHACRERLRKAKGKAAHARE